jgi:hypothetical protein
MAFWKYVVKAINGLDGLILTKAELENGKMDDKLGEWLNITAYYTHRMVFAPLIESVVLLP